LFWRSLKEYHYHWAQLHKVIFDVGHPWKQTIETNTNTESKLFINIFGAKNQKFGSHKPVKFLLQLISYNSWELT